MAVDPCPVCDHRWRGSWLARWARAVLGLKPPQYVCKASVADDPSGWGYPDPCNCAHPCHGPSPRQASP